MYTRPRTHPAPHLHCALQPRSKPNPRGRVFGFAGKYVPNPPAPSSSLATALKTTHHHPHTPSKYYAPGFPQPKPNRVHHARFSVSQDGTTASNRSPHPHSQPLHTPHQSHPTYSHCALHNQSPSRTKTECTALGFW